MGIPWRLYTDPTGTITSKGQVWTIGKMGKKSAGERKGILS